MTNTYPHKCQKCSFPARKIGNVVLCSRSKCSSKAVRSFGAYPVLIEGDTKENPIKVYCPKCNKRCSITRAAEDMEAVCELHQRVSYTYIKNKYYAARDIQQTVYMFNGSSLIRTSYELGING